jgi:type IV pilus assembly protein PilF
MRLVILTAAMLLTVSVSTLRADNRGQAEKQVQFGIQVAQHNLWREAIYWFERAAELDPTYPPASNNLAIAYEQQGDLEKARHWYERALKLDPNNQYIKQNYELFREIHDRANRRCRG